MNKYNLLANVLVLLLVGAIATGCGVKGDPLPHEGSDFPRDFPRS